MTTAREQQLLLVVEQDLEQDLGMDLGMDLQVLL